MKVIISTVNKKSWAYKIARYDIHEEVLLIFLGLLGVFTYLLIMSSELDNFKDSLDFITFTFIVSSGFIVIGVALRSIAKKVMQYSKFSMYIYDT